MNVIKTLLGLGKVDKKLEGLEAMDRDIMDSICSLAIKLGMSPSELETLKRDKEKMFEFVKGQAYEKSMALVNSDDKEKSEIGLMVREALNKINETSDKISP